MKTLVLVTGGFDPLHSGHIAYFRAAKQLGDTLVVGVNSDAWLVRKKGRAFMPWDERMNIVKNIKDVDFVLEFNDDDGSAKQAIKLARQTWPDHKIVFANGGDRTDANIPEMEFEDNHLEFAFGVGGFNKANSSSWILEEWKAPKIGRAWGYYRVLHEQDREVKVKELTVLPKTCLSMQRHQNRAEHWFVSEGTATVYTVDKSTDMDLLGEFTRFQHIHINQHQWHKLCNETDQPLKVVEIQYGDQCIEEDIERK
jgi:D-beta-D-heptose 7-phosphate kinase/D-beta-D-heptose 1-phosphate adenosyltransferase